jgi:hypothetical protein
MGAMQAQEVIQLGEARISYNPDAIVVNSDLNSVGFTVKENYIGEFTKNPIQFMKQNFDFKGLLSSVENKDDFDGFLVTFKSSKGYLEAVYTSEGELKRTHQRFVDKALPTIVRNQLYLENKGWTMASNKYIASGNSDRIDKEIYKIKLENGNKSRRVKIVPGVTILGVASN